MAFIMIFKVIIAVNSYFTTITAIIIAITNSLFSLEIEYF